MSFLDDIRKQPQGTREIMFGLSVFITVLAIGLVWFRSFERDIYTLLNPQEDVEKALAVQNAPVPSLFGYIWQTAGDVKGLVSGLFGNQQPTTGNLQQQKLETKGGKVYILPLSEYK